jgi:hypothetical protein
MWRDVFGWNLGLGRWGNTAAAEIRRKCDLPLLSAAMAEAKGWIYFSFFLVSLWRLGNLW